MARRCDLTGKKSQSGFSVPHSKHKTKRKFHVNLQTKRVTVGGRKVTLKLSTKAIKSLHEYLY